MNQCQADLERNKIDVGERGIEEYFSDTKIDVRSNLPFGTEVFENLRQILRVDTTILAER